MKVYLVGQPSFNETEFNHFLDEQGTTWRREPEPSAAEELVEGAGRICYMSFGERQSNRSNAEYIARLIQMGHESVLEHVDWSFIVSGVSRALTHQLVRHRVGFAFSQLSQQYCEQDEPGFVEPALVKRSPKAHEVWRRTVQVAQEAYREILEALNQIDPDAVPELDFKERHRAVRSAARSILPNATTTAIMVTVNGRALRHFLKVRGWIPGDEEMRLLAVELLRVVKKHSPAMFADFVVEQLADGSRVVKHELSGDMR